MESETNKAANSGTKARFPFFTITCLLFSLACLGVWRIYGHLHWRVIQHHDGELSTSLKTELFRLLGNLEVTYRLLGVCAVGFAILAIRQEPPIAKVLAAVFGLLALLASVSVM